MGCPLEIEERAAAPLAGGIANNGYQCGMLWGSALAAGAHAFRLLGPGPIAETAVVVTSQKLVESFRTCNRHKHTNCMEIIEINLQAKVPLRQLLKVFFKGNIVGCFTMVGRSARAAFKDINATIPGTRTEALSPPVSCAALLAKKLGASDMHTVMVAGLAGGIGLSGGGCGALGTAIWLNELQNLKEGAEEKVSSKVVTARAGDTVKKFLKSADYKFECSEIVGHKFENVADHATFLRDGGCAKIIGSLASGK
jgi:hypothetical protein